MNTARCLARGALALGCAVSTLALAEALVRRFDVHGINYARDVQRWFAACVEILPEADGEFHPDGLFFAPCPQAELALSRFEYATDERRLRRAPVNAPPVDSPPVDSLVGPTDRLRILFLGDSVTLGWGVDDHETWVRRLEREARAADGRALACFNAGSLIYNTQQEAAWLERFGEALCPELVVLTFVYNDLEDNWAKFLVLQAAPSAGPLGWRERLGFRTRESLRGLLALWRLGPGAEAAPASASGAPPALDMRQFPPDPAGWERVAQGMARIRAACERLGARLIVLDHGTSIVPAGSERAAEWGVAWHPFVFAPEESARPILNSRSDSHANALGNELLAAKARRALVEEGVLAP